MKKIDQLGTYKLGEELGKGGNGIVYEAKNENGDIVAIKVFLQRGDKPSKKEKKKLRRFKIEVKKVMEIQQEIDGIIPIVKKALPDKEKHVYWYAMPKAISVETKLKDAGIKEKVTCILELAKTLKILHQKEISHRDIKPGNIYYYNGKYCLGDFGLVDYPSKSDMTSLQEAVGPRATMAPEMRYNAKNADGKKADVYSLAKTMWILLKNERNGFEGKYDADDPIIGLRNDEQYRYVHLVELDNLLRMATEYDPALRPDMAYFVEKLEEWVEISSSTSKSNYSEWKYLQTKLMPETSPLQVEWRDIDSIIRVLNYIGSMPGLNHMFLPTGGGQDVDFAERATEDGCIYLMAGGRYVLKPLRLTLENFGPKDFWWSYFRLELQPMEPVSEELFENCRESLIEDYPGHYVVSRLMSYGRYDDGEEFPKGYKRIERYTKGVFVIFSKQSVYNHISGVYDARHNLMSSSHFRSYIGKMRRDFYRLRNWNEFRKIYDKNPFADEKEDDEDEIMQMIEESKQFDKYIQQSWNQWDFKEICDRHKSDKAGKLEYVIFFHINGEMWKRKYISEAGIIQEEDIFPFYSNKNGKYIFNNFDCAVNAINEILKNIEQKCVERDIRWDELAIYFTIESYRIEAPTHLFDVQEIENVLREGNDFRNNRLVIDEDGYAKLIADVGYEKYRHPVIQGSYDAGKNFVGPYANLEDVSEIYINLLQGWLQHLNTGHRCNVNDCYVEDGTMYVDELVREITKFYP